MRSIRCPYFGAPEYYLKLGLNALLLNMLVTILVGLFVHCIHLLALNSSEKTLSDEFRISGLIFAQLCSRHPIGFRGLPKKTLQLIATFIPTSSAAALALCNKNTYEALGTVYFESLRSGQDLGEAALFMKLLEKDLLPDGITCSFCQKIHRQNLLRDAKYPGIPRKIYRPCDEADRAMGFVKLHCALRSENFERLMKCRDLSLGMQWDESDSLGIDCDRLLMFSPGLVNEDKNARRVLRPIGNTPHGFTFELDFFFTSVTAKVDWQDEVESFTTVIQYPESPCLDCMKMGNQEQTVYTAKMDVGGASRIAVYFHNKGLKNQPKKGVLVFVICSDSLHLEHQSIGGGLGKMSRQEIKRDGWIVDGQ